MQEFGTLAYNGRDDNDGDSVNNWAEYGTGGSPHLDDSDGDGLNDSDEVYVHHSSPASSDGDGDGLDDPTELAMGLDPMNADDDNDGVPTAVECAWDGGSGYSAGTDMNPAVRDSDNDTVEDLMELAAGSDPLNPADARRVSIASIGATDTGLPLIGWEVRPNAGSVDITFVVQYSADLEDWEDVSELVTDGDSSTTAEVPDPVERGGRGYYRLRFLVR
jgi:hypothetical protein